MQIRKVSEHGDDLLNKKKERERERERNGLLIGEHRSKRSKPFERGALYLERRLSAFIVRARVHNEACIVLSFFVYSTVKSPVRSG